VKIRLRDTSIKESCIKFYKTFRSVEYARQYINLKEVDWQLTSIREGELILDVGSGKAVDAVRVALLGGFYVGVDIELQELLYSRKIISKLFPEILSQIDLVVADATRLPFRDEVFDQAVSYSAIEHVNPSLRTSWISEMSRVIKEECIVVITCQNTLSLICYLNLPFRVIDVSKLSSPKIVNLLSQYLLYFLAKIFPSLSKYLILRSDYHEDFITPKKLFKLLSLHGLYPIEFNSGTLYYWGYAPPKLVFSRFALKIGKILSRLEKSPLYTLLKYFCLRFGYRAVKIS